MTKEYYQKHRAESLLRSKKWAEANKEKLRIYMREYVRKWRKANRDSCNRTKRRWIAKNPEKAKEGEQKWREANKERYRAIRKRANDKWAAKNPDNGRKRTATYRRKYPDRVNEANRKAKAFRRSTDISFRILHNLRGRFWKALKRGQKSGSVVTLIGCSIDELKWHLARRFQLGMTMFNYGTVWHIDHVKLCKHFDLSDPVQQAECFNYSNLQPLFIGQNVRKNQ